MSAIPDGAYCIGCAPSKKEEITAELLEFLKWIRKNPPPQESDVHFTTTQVEAIRRVLKDLVIFSMERAPKSLVFLDR